MKVSIFEKSVNWKLYFLLLIGSILSSIAVLPYARTLQGGILEVTFLSLILQNAIVFGIIIFVGLHLSKKLGLRISILENFVNSKKITIGSTLSTSILFGILTGFSIIFLDCFIFVKLGISEICLMQIPLWQGFLASFYGGVCEEIILRLFLMTLIVWVLSKLTKFKRKIVTNNKVMWSSIIISAIFFGLAHLPAAAASISITLTTGTIFRIILLNGIAGIVFGWLYWKKGLESAMIAHFSADIMLHVFPPFFLRIMMG